MNAPTLTSEENITAHLKMIRQIAWKLHYQTNFDQEDLFSEGCLLYLLKKDKFIKRLGNKFTTFIYKAVYNGLLDYIRNNSKVVLSLPEDEVVPLYTKHIVRDKFVHGTF